MPNKIKVTPEMRKKICDLWEIDRDYGLRSTGKNKHGSYTAKQIGKFLNIKPITVYMIATGNR